MTWHDLGVLRFATSACVKVAGKELAVFRVGAGYAALENSCPHQGGPLAEGVVKDGHVLCPWHGWRFELATGVCTTLARDSTQSFRVREQAGRLEVEIP